MASPTTASDEVAADFKESLQDLQVNNRFEISNLTIIAKENIEHALAISRVLEHHIKTTPSERKLPALYVLDSIVKNVGTPYNIYLGRNLFDTFMSAYTLVDGQTRKNMESMLKTWKESVPGSMESRPVFQVETTRSIENALIKARTAFVQQQQARTQRPVHALPPRPVVAANSAYMNTPTPPQIDAHLVRPPSSSGTQYGFPNQQVGTVPPLPIRQTPLTCKFKTQFPPVQYTHQPPYSTPPTNQSYTTPTQADTLHEDLQRLVMSAKNEFASNPYDTGIQSKLKALLDLQTILNTQQLPPDQKQMIRQQVAQLTAAADSYRNVQAPSNPPQTFSNPPATSYPQRYLSPPPLQQLPISTNDLAALLSSSVPGRQPTPPVQQSTAPPPPSLHNLANLLGATAPLPGSVQQSSAPPNPLLDQLRAAGMLPSANPPSRPTSAMQTQGGYLAPPSTGQAIATPPIPTATLPRTPLAELQNDIKLNMASLKKPRPQLVNALFVPLPSQCNTCGRRFPATPAGKASKDRHLDFHFRSNQRLAEAARRSGISRSWFIDEMEWIRFRESDDGDGESERAGSEEGTSAEKKGTNTKKAAGNKMKFVKAPSDAAMSTRTCPICQESFETVWHDEVQEWVWMDAEVANGRVYHASCRAEVAKDGAGMKSVGGMRRSITPSIPARKESSTPDSVLGKRKAEADMGSGRMKREMVA